MRLLVLGLALLCTACRADVFACASDEDCQGGAMPGMCAAAGACSFPDAECVSGQRYGDHAGELSGKCVPDEGTTGDASMSTTIDPSITASLDGSDPTSGAIDGSDAAEVSTGGGSSSDAVTVTTESSATADDGSTTGEPIDPDLLVWLRFEDAPENGQLVNSGTLGGFATCVEDCPDAGYGMAEFGGLDDCLSFASDPAFAGPITLAAWVWRGADDVGPGMFLFGKRFGLLEENTWELYFDVLELETIIAVEMYGPPDVDVPVTAPEIDTWVHVVATWDAMGGVRLFLDGELVSEKPLDALAFDDQQLHFGCDDNAGLSEWFFEGAMADVRIYGHVLAQDQIAALTVDVPPPPP